MRPRSSRSNPAVIVDVTGFQWQWTFAYPGYVAADGKPISFTGAGSQGPEMVLPIKEDVHIRVHRAGRDPFVLRAAVLLQEGRHSRAHQRVPGEHHGDGHLRRPVRRVLRPRPRQHVLHGPRGDARPSSPSGPRTQVEKANATPPPLPSGAAAVDLTAVSITQRLRAEDADGTGQHAVDRSSSPTRTPRLRTTSPSRAPTRTAATGSGCPSTAVAPDCHLPGPGAEAGHVSRSSARSIPT